jgi:hypothetical protein
MMLIALIVFVGAALVLFFTVRALVSAVRQLPPGGFSARHRSRPGSSSPFPFDSTTSHSTGDDDHQRHMAQHLAHHHGMSGHDAALMQQNPGLTQHMVDHHNAMNSCHTPSTDIGSSHGHCDVGSSSGGSDFGGGSGGDFGGSNH